MKFLSRLSVFSGLLTIFTLIFFVSCSQEPGSSSSSYSSTPTWSTIFSADFNGPDGQLVGDWIALHTTASNYNNMARGCGSTPPGQMAICNLNVSNVAHIRLTMRVSNFVNQDYSANLIARMSESYNGYVAWMDSQTICIDRLNNAISSNIVSSSISLTATKWYILEFELKLSGESNLIARVKDYDTGSNIQTISGTDNDFNFGMCGFCLMTPTDYLYVDDFKVEKSE